MKDILTQARDKIENPAHWTQHALARDINGEKSDGRDELACKWCALGAVQAVTTTDEQFTTASAALIRASRELFGIYSISTVNDECGHEAVLLCYDRAIREAT